MGRVVDRRHDKTTLGTALPHNMSHNSDHLIEQTMYGSAELTTTISATPPSTLSPALKL